MPESERWWQGQSGPRRGAGGYVSCIRVDGAAILPPLMTDACRAEAARWRLQALAVERRLREQTSPAPDRESSPSSCTAASNDAGGGGSPSWATSTHRGGELGDGRGGRVPEAPRTAAPGQGAPPAAPRLAVCLLDVADFSDGGCTLLQHHGTVCPPDTMAGAALPHRAGTETAAQEEGEETWGTGPPRLVRSGSYTLTDPSPVLLAHLERQSMGGAQQPEEMGASGAADVGTGPRPASPDASASSTSGPSTCDDDFLDSVFGNSTDKNDGSAWEVLARSWLGGGEDAGESADQAPGTPPAAAWGGREGGVEAGPADWGSGGGGDDDLLRRLQRELALTAPHQTPPSTPPPGEEEQEEDAGVAMVAAGEEQREEGRPCAAAAPAHRPLIRQVEGDGQVEEEEMEEERERRRHRAACLIGAAARGYLTRRLMRTERVQSLIRTIHDAVVCAVQLHEVQQLEEADVELHRRLIQQVSAACYAFHDVFFALGAADQMAAIAADRKRNLERAKKSVIHT